MEKWSWRSDDRGIVLEVSSGVTRARWSVRKLDVRRRLYEIQLATGRAKPMRVDVVDGLAVARRRVEAACIALGYRESPTQPLPAVLRIEGDGPSSAAS